MTRHGLIFGLLTSTAVGALAVSARADPPERVGRVAAIDGGVSFQPPGADDWSWASRNYPVTDGESFWTGDDGRIELQVGAVDVRADSETEIDVPTLRYGEMRLALPQGSLDIRVRRAPEGGVTVTTPAGDVRFDQAGLFRVDVGAPTSDGSYPLVEVTTLEGDAGAPSPEGLVDVPAGQAAVLYAGYDPQLQAAQYAAVDDWGHELEARVMAQTTGEDSDEALTGYDDLAAAGDFSQDAEYGQVWYPRDVPADWAPYRYGHWSYVEPWGYTWIDDQSWGFAPFHYGRWAQIEGRWAWIPGQRSARPVYAPALVAFVGGASWDFGGGGAVGWVPLAPQEVYRPSYRVSDSYLRQVNVNNVRNTTIVNNLTANTVTVVNYRNVGAATLVKSATFSDAAPVQRAAIPVSAAALAQAPAFVAANRPAPSPRARSGAPVAVAGRPAPTTVAARPPERIAAVRAAVVAPPPAANRPPVIAGARIAPPPRPVEAAARPVLVAPAQVRNPAAQRAAAVAAPRAFPTVPVRPSQPGTAMAAPRPAAEPHVSPSPRPIVDAASEEARAAAQARQAQATAAQAQAREAQAARAQSAQAQAAGAREAQARQAEAETARAQAAQAMAARNATQAQSQAQARAAQQAQQAQQAQMRAREAPSAVPRGAPPPPPQAQAKAPPPRDTEEKRRGRDDPATPRP